jgi:hypothetical protein
MDDISIFEDVRIREAWFDPYGLLKSVAKRAAEGSRKVRAHARRAAQTGMIIVASSLIGLNSAVHATTPEVPTQLALQWPAEPTAQHTKQLLADSLHAIRRTSDDWNGIELTKPAPKSMAAAQTILQQLPDIFADASAGVDGDGNIYFTMKQGEKIAFLTVAPPSMHLLYMEPGHPNLYIDNEQFKGKVLPARIKSVLDEKLGQ